jgi:hypothetical protein
MSVICRYILFRRAVTRQPSLCSVNVISLECPGKVCPYCPPCPRASPRSGKLAEVNRREIFAVVDLVRPRVRWVHVVVVEWHCIRPHILCACVSIAPWYVNEKSDPTNRWRWPSWGLCDLRCKLPGCVLHGALQHGVEVWCHGTSSACGASGRVLVVCHFGGINVVRYECWRRLSVARG